MADDPATRLREHATEVATMVVTGVWLALLFLPFGADLWLPVMLFGYVVVIPLVALLFGDEADREEWWDWTDDESADRTGEAEADDEGIDESASVGTDADAPGDALETLRERYAAGELTDDQFERKLERLLATETLEDADRWRESAREDRDLEYDT